MATMIPVRPRWYTREDDTAWERVKEAFRRDWEQTKHDFGGKVPDLNQQIGDTVQQATGAEPIPPLGVRNPQPVSEGSDVYNDDEDMAYRFGYAAFRHHGNAYDWNPATEAKLRNDWGSDAEWQQHRNAVRRGWFFARNEHVQCDPQ